MADQLVVFDGDSSASDEDGSFTRLETTDAFLPGYFWRVKQASDDFVKGDVHLLLEIIEFENTPHSVKLQYHPRDGDGTHTLLVADFLSGFEPAADGEKVREREQQDVMRKMAEIQEEMTEAQVNPLGLPGIQEAAKEATEKLEQVMAAEVASSDKSEAERQRDLARIHRRASRRSAAAGNPLVVKVVAISNNVSEMVNGGVNSEGLKELTIEARRRAEIAKAVNTYLVKRAGDLQKTVASLTPYFAEKGKVALARASKAVTFANGVGESLRSLRLYTGDGTDVVTILEGADAPTHEPLTLLQGKRFMDEELAVWADVDESFDWTDQAKFFDTLKANRSLLEQVLPMQRCVATMAVTRHESKQQYSSLSAFEAALNEMKNRQVFLLVRNGDSVHVVYSGEPSHEASPRLFPTREDLARPFKGVDGTKIGLHDIQFGKSAARFEDLSLHYKRFLILLCGLDHRLKLFGEFYPADRAMEFMSQQFQNTYFRFLEDDDPGLQIGDSLMPVAEWIHEKNKAVRSGSRIVAQDELIRKRCPAVLRQYGLEIDKNNLPRTFTVLRDGENHCFSVPTHDKYKTEKGSATVWLDGPRSQPGPWFLCLDTVRAQELRRYVFSRISRTGNIGWLRAARRGLAAIEADLADEQELRAHLKSSAQQGGVLADGEIDDAIDLSIGQWRAAHRGVPAPDAGNTKAVNEILTLMYPSDRIAADITPMLDRLVQSLGVEPLLLARTGKNRLVLYTEASEAEKAPYLPGIHWGWVKRRVVDVLKSKLSVVSESFVWLQKEKPNAAESEVRRWPALDMWVHETPAQCRLPDVLEMKAQMDEAPSRYAPLLKAEPGGGIDEEVLDEILSKSQALLSNLKSYEQPKIAIPIGIYQKAQDTPVQFLYVVASAPGLVTYHGTPEQAMEMKRVIRRRFKEELAQGEMRPDPSWRFVLSKAGADRGITTPLQDTIILEDAYHMAPWTRIRSHGKGGVKRAEYKWRHFGSQPRDKRSILLRNEEATLSPNRALQVLLGLAPHLRREFYEKQEKARLHAKSFIWARQSGDAVQTFDQKYVPAVPAAHLSPLIWNAEREQPVANKWMTGKFKESSLDEQEIEPGIDPIQRERN